MAAALLLIRRIGLAAAALLVAWPVAAQRLALYETRSIVLSREQVDELAGRSYWKDRLARQTDLTLIGGSAAAVPPDALFAAVASWLPASPGTAPADWVFALDAAGKTRQGARVTLAAGTDRPALWFQPLELDQVVGLEAPAELPQDWRPKSAASVAGFPEGVEPYCDARVPVCATVFGWLGDAPSAHRRDLVTVTRLGAQTTFHVEHAGIDGAGSPAVVRYLGETGVTPLAPPPDYAQKDALDLQFERLAIGGAGAVGQVRGCDGMPLRERVAVKSAILAYLQSGTRSAEADVVLPAGPRGEDMLYTLRFLPSSGDVTVEALGPAAALLPAAGPSSDVRRIPGFPARASASAVRTWLQRRYPALQVRGATADEIVANADRAINQNSALPGWFTGNYGITLLEPKAADRRLAELHERRKGQRGGLKRFDALERRTLEAVLQTIGERALALLRDTAMVRQVSGESASPFGEQTRRVTTSGNTFTLERAPGDGGKRPEKAATVVIYDSAHSSSRFIGGRGPDDTIHVYPPVAEVIAHELGHVLGARARVQHRFNDLARSLDVAPFTRYAASHPETEYFPEAMSLFLLDPAWVQANHPALYEKVWSFAQQPRANAFANPAPATSPTPRT